MMQRCSQPIPAQGGLPILVRRVGLEFAPEASCRNCSLLLSSNPERGLALRMRENSDEEIEKRFTEVFPSGHHKRAAKAS